MTSFERDFEALHGHRPFPRGRRAPGVEIVSDPPKSRTTGHRLVVGVLGLFWALVLGVFLIGFAIVIVVMVVAAFS